MEGTIVYFYAWADFDGRTHVEEVHSQTAFLAEVKRTRDAGYVVLATWTEYENDFED